MRKGVRRAGESGGVAFTPEGFTLIEVLLALVLLSVILGAIYSTFILSHKAMEGMDQSLVKLQECRMAIDAICREIESLTYTPGREKAVFKIEDRDLYGKQVSRFSFQTFSPLIPGSSLVSYYVEEVDGKLNLLKRIHSSHQSVTEEPGYEVVEEIESFLVEAKFQDSWIRTWDASEAKKVPEEIRITITALFKDRRLSIFERASPKIGRAI